MNAPSIRLKGFQISVTSAFAGFLLFGGFEALVRLGRDPIAQGVMQLLSRFSHAMPRQMPPTDWSFFCLNLAIAVVFLLVGVTVGARRLKKKRAATN